MALKPEIITSLELWQIASKFQRQIRDFQPRVARQKISEMIATTTDCHKLQDWCPKHLCCFFPLSVVVAIARGQFLHSERGRKSQVCRRNCSDICHTVGDGEISTSGLDGHIAISGYPSVSHLFMDYDCPLDDDSGFVRHRENVQIPLFTLLRSHLIPFSVCHTPKTSHLWSLYLSFMGVQCW